MVDREEPMDFEEGCTTSLDYPHPHVSMEDAHCDDEDMKSIPYQGLFDATRIQTDKHDDQNKGGRTDAFQRFLHDSKFDLEDTMSLSEYELSIEDLIFDNQEREIGRGVSRVGFKRGYFVGYNRDIYKTAAVKRLRKSHEEEVRIIRKLQHPNIISFIAYLEQPHVHFLLITECAEFGSLSGVLKTKRLRSEIPLPEDLFLRWCYDLIRAVEYLHSKFVWHRDIKSGNCLICSREVLKLCDFGLSREIDDSVSHITTSVGKGTHRWMAPEVIEHRRHSTSSDVYSMSMVFLEMCSGNVPFSNIEIPATVSYKVVKEHLRPEIPVECPKYVKSLLPKCWSRDAHNRPKIAEIKQKIVSAMSPELKDATLSRC